MSGTFTLTFGDQAENHVGMQKIGTLASEGFSIDDINNAKVLFEKMGCKCELIKLNDSLKDVEEKIPEAVVLVVRNGVKAFGIEADEMLKEQVSLTYDTKAYMYGRVVNKIARHNLCFAVYDQDPSYENKKGRIINFKHLPLLAKIRNRLPEVLGKKAKDLAVEGNHYYDSKKCGIGFHGDAERRKVIAIRLGDTLPLHYQWFNNSKPVGERIELELNHGDLYVMSEKATGSDWRKRKIHTLRHAAGAKKYLTIKKKK